MKLNLGIVGTSWISQKAVEAAHQTNLFNVQTIYSRTAESGQKFASENKVATATTNFDDLYKLDVVYIASPNELHFDQAEKLLNNKVHVICEKPIVPGNFIKANKLYELAEQNNVFIFEALKTIFTPNFLMIKDIIKNINNVKLTSFGYCQTSSKVLNDSYKTASTFLRKYGGGVHNDLGIYVIRLIIELFGEPRSISSFGADFINDCYQTILINFKYSNQDISCTLSKIKNSNEGGMVLLKNNDYITFDNCSTIYTISKNKKVLKTEQFENDMFYEFKNFSEIITSKNKIAYNKLKNNSLKSIKILETIDAQIYN